MFVLGITGGIGSGKSTVSNILKERGLKVLDADYLSHKVTEAGGVAVPEIAEVFGKRAVCADGSMNRKYVSSVVFKDNTKLDILSSIIHKYVLQYMAEEIDKERAKSTKCVVLDVPIPVKKGFVDKCNQIWVVTCDETVRIKRLIDRGMTKEEAQRRIAVQMTDEEYLALGDFEINNSDSLDKLNERVEELITKELFERGIRI